MNFGNNSRYEIFNLNRNKFNPNQNNKFGTLRAGDDMIFNKKNISSDIISSSSASSASSASSVASSSGTSEASSKSSRKSKKASDTASEYSNSGSEVSRSTTKSFKGNQNIVSDNLKEKKEIIYQLDRLEQRGFKVPFKFNLNSDIEEMRLEYNKLLKEKEIDSSIRFQRKMLMAFVTGSEYLNNRYDPFAIQLDGWSEQIHDNICDYDDIFEELHDKYKHTGKKMAPELRLFISLSGSAFMFHLTNRMFKEQPLPDVQNVLKSNPELMKKFQEAATKEYINPQPRNNNISGNQVNGPGLFGMVSGLFNNLGNGSMRQNINQMDDDDDSISEIDSIIDNVHKDITYDSKPNTNNIETLSVSDEEITSIIEDTADINILKSNNKGKNKRSLNI